MGNDFKVALQALLRNRLQASLTLSGMSVGVAMVVIVAGLARGAQLNIEAQIERAGPTQVTVRSGNLMPAAIYSSGEQDSGGGEVSQGGGGDGINDARVGASGSAAPRPAAPRRTLVNRTPPAPLTEVERRVLAQDIDHVRAVAASVIGNQGVDAGSTSVSVVRVAGFEVTWPEMASWRLVEGRWITPAEHRSGAPVAMVTTEVASRLWPATNTAVGQTLSMAGRTLRIVGVLSKGGDSADEHSLVVPTVHVPLALAQALLQRGTLDSITVRTTSVGETRSTARQITSALRTLHGLAPGTMDDFQVDTQSVSAMPGMGLDPGLARAVHSNVAGLEQAAWEATARSLRQAARTFTLLLAAAATVSLAVGGIGVMNIMLVSVAMRTREIGLRMALGAKALDVMSQFLVEAVTLAAVGGVIGVALGLLGLFIAKHGLHWSAAVSPVMLSLAMIMAALTGVVFGFAPARRAALMDPVIALRSE